MKKIFCKRKRGFTLAEVLITLMIIGVVAALTIPALIQSSTKNKFPTAYKKMNAAIQNGFGQMIAHESLVGYDSTEAFMQDFKKYFKVNSTCANDQLASCFASKFTSGGEEVELSKLKTAKNLGKEWEKDTNVNGVVFSDGTSALIAYNAAGCTASNTSSQEDIIKNCVAIVFDLDGPKKTNNYTANGESDIGFYNAALSLAADCGLEIGTNTGSNFWAQLTGADKDTDECYQQLQDAYNNSTFYATCSTRSRMDIYCVTNTSTIKQCMCEPN